MTCEEKEKRKEKDRDREKEERRINTRACRPLGRASLAICHQGYSGTS